jgi:recombinational DNA repair protein RecR
MAYTPELTMKSSRTLRRIAWVLDMPMTKAIEKVFEYLPKILDSEKVCQACRDKSRCSECGFSSVKQNQDEKEVVE